MKLCDLAVHADGRNTRGAVLMLSQRDRRHLCHSTDSTVWLCPRCAQGHAASAVLTKALQTHTAAVTLTVLIPINKSPHMVGMQHKIMPFRHHQGALGGGSCHNPMQF